MESKLEGYEDRKELMDRYSNILTPEEAKFTSSLGEIKGEAGFNCEG